MQCQYLRGENIMTARAQKTNNYWNNLLSNRKRFTIKHLNSMSIKQEIKSLYQLCSKLCRKFRLFNN